MNVAFRLLSSHARAPEYSTMHSAGFDFFSFNDDFTIPPMGFVTVNTGVEVHWDDPNVFLKLESKSGLAAQGVTCQGGVIDIDYRKEIKVILYNFSNTPVDFKYGEKICQGIFITKPMVNMYHVEMHERDGSVFSRQFFPQRNTERTGGFGSTGK